jgi:sugar phosphate permease
VRYGGNNVTKTVHGKRWLRIIPVAFLMYTVAFMDRVNIGFAGQGMAQAFHVNAAAIGLTFGAFFAGYTVLQIPGGYIADRWGSKLWVTLLLIAWAACAVFSGLAQTEQQELLARFLLGVAEGGLWPAVLLLISRWFPRDERASANALFQICLPVGALLSAPLSGWLVSAVSWREMIIFEGLPPLVWALVWWLAIDDSPSTAKWMPAEERDDVERRLAEERRTLVPLPPGVGWKAMIHPVVWLITITYFLSIMGGYGLMLWMPTIVKTLGVSSTGTGLLLMIPNFVAVFVLVYAGWISDRLQNRKIVVFVSAIGVLFALLGLLWLARAHITSVWLTILFMTIATAAGFAKQAPIWAIPTQILPAGAAGLGLAVIGLIGNLGGLTGPWLMGYLRATTHSFLIGFLALAGCVALSAVLALFIPESKPIDLQGFKVTFWKARSPASEPQTLAE